MQNNNLRDFRWWFFVTILATALTGCTTSSLVRVDHDRQVIMRVQTKPEIDLDKSISEKSGRFVFAVKDKSRGKWKKPFKVIFETLKMEADRSGFIEVLSLGRNQRRSGDALVSVNITEFGPGSGHGKDPGGDFHVHYIATLSMEINITNKRGGELKVVSGTSDVFSVVLDYFQPIDDARKSEAQLQQELASKVAKTYLARLLPGTKKLSLPLLAGNNALDAGINALVRRNSRGAKTIFQQVLADAGDNANITAPAHNNLAVLYAKKAGDALNNDQQAVDDLVAKAEKHIQLATMLHPENNNMQMNAGAINNWAEVREWIRKRKKN